MMLPHVQSRKEGGAIKLAVGLLAALVLGFLPSAAGNCATRDCRELKGLSTVAAETHLDKDDVTRP